MKGCAYCSQPLPPRRRTRCGRDECERAARRAIDAVYRRERLGVPPRKVVPCVGCGEVFRGNHASTMCAGCQRRHAGKSDIKRANYWGVLYEPIDRLRVFERDGWACGICSEPVDRTVPFPDPGCPTLDHVIPMSGGGDHLYGNVQLAHFACNMAKGGVR